MKKKEYMKPEMHIYEISKMQLLAGSETLRIGNNGDEDVPTSVSSFDVWDVYFKNGKWMSYNEDYGEVPVEKWTLTDDDYVIDIHTKL